MTRMEAIQFVFNRLLKKEDSDVFQVIGLLDYCTDITEEETNKLVANYYKDKYS